MMTIDQVSALREARLSAGATLQQVADAIGISKAYLSDLELGRRTGPVEVARRLARYYATSIEALFPGENVSDTTTERRNGQ